MSELVEKLSQGDHRVEISIRPDRTPQALKQCIDKGYVHLKFTETRGGTDLYVPLEPEASNLSAGNFEQGTGQITLIGQLTLDFVPVRCIADINLETMDGRGRLQTIPS